MAPAIEFLTNPQARPCIAVRGGLAGQTADCERTVVGQALGRLGHNAGSPSEMLSYTPEIGGALSNYSPDRAPAPKPSLGIVGHHGSAGVAARPGGRSTRRPQFLMGFMLLLLLGAVALCGNVFQTRFVGISSTYSQSGCNPPNRTLSGATECFAYAAVDLNFVAFNDSPGAIMMQPAQSWQLGLVNYQIRIGMGPTCAGRPAADFDLGGVAAGGKKQTQVACQ